jgi:ferredoxin
MWGCGRILTDRHPLVGDKLAVDERQEPSAAPRTVGAQTVCGHQRAVALVDNPGQERCQDRCGRCVETCPRFIQEKKRGLVEYGSGDR